LLACLSALRALLTPALPPSLHKVLSNAAGKEVQYVLAAANNAEYRESGDSLVEITSANHTRTLLAGRTHNLSHPVALAANRGGDLFIVNRGYGGVHPPELPSILLYTPSSKKTTAFLDYKQCKDLTSPWSAAVDPETGVLYVSVGTSPTFSILAVTKGSCHVLYKDKSKLIRSSGVEVDRCVRDRVPDAH
jgi:hypothetical protein